jgi:hypothetical protein
MAHTAQALQHSTHLNQADVALLEGVLELCVVQLLDGVEHVILRLKLGHANSLAAVTVHICEGGLDVLPEVVLQEESTSRQLSGTIAECTAARYTTQPGSTCMSAHIASHLLGCEQDLHSTINICMQTLYCC